MHMCWRGVLVVFLSGLALASPETGYGQAAAQRTDDFRVWAAIAGSDESSDFETFLRVYPNSLLAPLARGRLSAIRQRSAGDTAARATSRGETGRLYRYRNSSVPMEESGVPIVANRLHIRLDAPTGSTPVSVPVDDEKLMAMCGDENGCSVSLGLVGWVDRGLAVEAPLVNSACRFFVRLKDGQRHWHVQSSCFQWYALHGADEKGNLKWNEKAPGWYVPYWSGISGIDGLDKLPNNMNDRSHVLYTGSCVLSESPPDPESKGSSNLLPDTRPGFYLTAGTPQWGGGNYPAAAWPHASAGRACELTIED